MELSARLCPPSASVNCGRGRCCCRSSCCLLLLPRCCCCCFGCVFGASSVCIHEYVIEFCGVLSILFFPPAFQFPSLPFSLFFFSPSTFPFICCSRCCYCCCCCSLCCCAFSYNFVARLPLHPLNFNIFTCTLVTVPLQWQPRRSDLLLQFRWKMNESRRGSS